jgi:hypothetical protein
MSDKVGKAYLIFSQEKSAVLKDAKKAFCLAKSD